MSKYRKKPVVIEAEQFWPDNTPHPEGVQENGFLGEGHFIHTLEGDMKVRPGDWIITGVQGERYPCKPGIFEQTYEPVGASDE
ncbi:MAG: hypothetical protein V3S51_02045 [Dehalococcoidia bacterium]